MIAALKIAQAKLRAELERIDRREDDLALAELCREFKCQPGEVGRKADELFRKLKDAEVTVTELERSNDDLGAENTDLTEKVERFCRRTIDFGKVEETLARLKEAGPKVVNLQVTMEIGGSEP